ncbi:DNA polymerase III subunit epsilon [Hellea balneolensis]|uniref:DNA polymerase III subunit epsilon n=1 Tax=Hellea balneolensis TaxID=287478 RepID=UPI00040F61B2|nr:DNA polymerase III subunit epsilon [Hellea balneolensis]
MTGIREICFDTETTGFNARGDDRITEIGCIELIDMLPTGREFHALVDPERDIPDKVTELTGHTLENLRERGAKVFKAQAQDFLDFIGDSQLVAHNADFDRGFINAELERAGFEAIANHRFTDTLQMAREKFPGSPASLDALCKRYGVSLASRDKHGAIIDSILLAEVYLQLKGGRMHKLGLEPEAAQAVESIFLPAARQRPSSLKPLLSEAEREQHKAFIDSMGDEMVWNKYWRRA